MLRNIVPVARSGVRQFSASTPANMKVVAVLYKGGEHAKEQPKLLGTIENQLGQSPRHPTCNHDLTVC